MRDVGVGKCKMEGGCCGSEENNGRVKEVWMMEESGNSVTDVFWVK